jgi:hypothetical protein
MAPTASSSQTSGRPGSWTVTGQAPGVGPDSQGRTVQGITVQFVTGLGVPGSVFIPRAQYAPDAVKAAIAAHAADLDAVQGLSG